MRKCLLTMTLILVLACGYSQQVDSVIAAAPLADTTATEKIRIHGTVTDEKDKPMEGVAVGIKGTNNGQVTDSAGHFELFVNKGTHTLDLSYMGYTKRSIAVTVYDVKSKQVDVQMEEEGKLLDIVVVTGTKYEKPLTEQVVSMEVLKAGVITQSNAKMDEAMNKVPGVNMLGKTISIRGGSGFSDATSNRVLALLDDMPIILPENGSIVWDMVPIEALEQVEVIKGSSSALYGSSALNGVLNLRTINPKPEMVNKLILNYGLYDQPKNKKWSWWWHQVRSKKNGDLKEKVEHPMFGGGLFTHAKQYGDFGVVLSASYQQDAGFRYDNDYKRARLSTKLRYTPHKMPSVTTGLNMGFYHQNLQDFFTGLGLDSNMYLASSSPPSVKQRTMYFDPYINYYDKKDNRHSLKFRVFNSLYYSGTGDSTVSTQVNYDYTFVRNFNKLGLVITAGTNGFYSKIQGKTFGELVVDITKIKYFTTRDIVNVAGFIQAEKKLWKRVTLSGGFRLEYARLAGEQVKNRLPLINILNKAFKGKNDIYSPVTPLARIGVSVQASKGTFLRWSFGQGFRYPSMAEKFVYTLRSGAQVFPNDSLRPENGWSTEIGIKQGVKISNWMAYFDVSGFVMRYHDMIEFQLYENYPDSIQLYGIPFRAQNVNDARIMGVEVSAVANGKIFGVPLNFIIGYSYLDPRNLSYNASDPNSTKILKYRIQHSFKADIQTNYKGLVLGLNMFYNSFMKEIDGGGIGALQVVKKWREIHHHGDFVMDVRAGYSYKDKFNFTFICKNVLNTEYMLRPALIEAPRNYTFQVGYNF